MRVQASMCYFNNMFKFPGLLLHFSSQKQSGGRDDLIEESKELIHLSKYDKNKLTIRLRIAPVLQIKFL